MALATYSDLQASIKDWLARTGFLSDAVVQDFISLCEEKLYYDLRVREMICHAQADLNEEYEWLPEDFLEARHVNILEIDGTDLATGTITNQYHLPFEDNREFVRYSRTGSKPSIYTVVGERIRFAPYPDVASGESSGLGFELVYYAKWTKLSDTNTTTQILTQYPQLMLFGSLVQSEGYLFNDPRAAQWQAQYRMELDNANWAGQRSEYGTSAVGIAY